MAMLRTYIDASGSDGKSAFLVVCGYLAELDQWSAFERDWNELLDSEGVRVFHMSDLIALKGEFQGWNESRQRNFLAGAFAIIKERTIAATTGIVSIPDCETYYPIPKTRKRRQIEKRTMFSKEYAVAGLACVIGLSRVARRVGYSEQIHHIFEIGDNGYLEIEGALKESFADETERSHYLLNGGFTAISKKGVAQFCCADILANQVRAEVQTKNSVMDVKFDRWPVVDLVRPQDRWVYAYDRKNLPTLKSLVDYFGNEVCNLNASTDESRGGSNALLGHDPSLGDEPGCERRCCRLE